MLGPSPKKNPTRTYSADAGLYALGQGPEEDPASKQTQVDKTNLNLKEQGRPVAVLPNLP